MESDDPPALVLASAALRTWEAEARREREEVQAAKRTLEDKRQRFDKERCVWVRISAPEGMRATTVLAFWRQNAGLTDLLRLLLPH